MTILAVVLGLLLLFAIVVVIVLVFKYSGSKQDWLNKEDNWNKDKQYEIEQLLVERDNIWKEYAEEHAQEVKNAALRGQAAKISGDTLQRYCVFSESYPYNIRDAHPVFILFDWVVLVGEKDGSVTEVVIQEMKSGTGEYPYALDNSIYSGKLLTKQRTLRNCVLQGKVRWETWYCNKLTGEWNLIPSPVIVKAEDGVEEQEDADVVIDVE